MQISVWYVAAAGILLFVFGFGLACACDAALLGRWRRRVRGLEETLALLHNAVRVTLSDAWYKRVIRRFQRDAERKAGGGAL